MATMWKEFEGSAGTTVENSPYDDWDPMGDVSKHFLNLVNLDSSNDPLGLGITAESYRLPIEDTPCKFYKYDSKFKSCGREGCRYLHARTKNVVPIFLQDIILSDQLQKKTQAEDGIINAGIVVSASDPGDFCIVPYSDWICSCKLEYIGQEKEEKCDWRRGGGTNYGQSGGGGPVRNAGVANLLRLFEDFRQFERTQQLAVNVTSVSTNQVVAVNLPSLEKKNVKEWYRGIVLEDSMVGAEQSTVSIYLIDYGKYIEAEFKQISLLPSKLSRYPPLGYCCSLNGVSPISHRWSHRARNLFSNLVTGKDCVFELIQASYPKDEICETVPNLVELSVKINGEYVNLSEQLILEGLALEWNQFPQASEDLTEGIMDSKARGIELLLSSQRNCCLSNPHLELKLSTEDDKSRLENCLRHWIREGQSSITSGIGTHQPEIPYSFSEAGSTRSLSDSVANNLLSRPSFSSTRLNSQSLHQEITEIKYGQTRLPSGTANNFQLKVNTAVGVSADPQIPQKQLKSKTKWKPLKL